ncbi:MAG TPA: ABC transporter permease [Pelotomaculum sp.]|nr:ABC transporter permease [Pelotomaculum sp.]
MNLFESLRLAVEGIRVNKLRSFLTLLGIIIGIAAVIMVVSIGQGGRALLLKEMEKIGSNFFTLYVDWEEGEPPNERDFTVQDVAVIKELVPEISLLAPSNYGSAIVQGPKDKKPAQVIGTDSDYAGIFKIKVTRGSFLGTSRSGPRAVVVLDEQLARDVFGSVDPLGKRVSINNNQALVIGLSKEESGITSMRSAKNIYVPLDFWQEMFERRTIEQLEGSAVGRGEVQTAMDQAVKILERRHQTRDRYKSISMDQQMQITGKITGILTYIIGSVAGFSLLVGGIGVMNIMLVSVTERTREIGIRMALGARRRDIMLQFLIEAVVLCLVGGFAGAVIGSGGAAVFAWLLKWPSLVSWSAILIAFAFSSAVGVFFGLYPAARASGMDPIEALRQE